MAARTSATAVPDLRKRLRPLLNPPREPVMVDVPELGYLMVDGLGAPEASGDAPTNDFQAAIQTLYPLAYTLHFRLKKEGLSMPVMPLEALWFNGPDESFDMTVAPEKWGWRAIIAVSDDVTPAAFEGALEEVRRKKGDFEGLHKIRFERWREGRVAQVMHIGPYADEAPTIERLHAFIAAQGCQPRGAHHEIYLGDPRNADPAKLKTVLRQPVAE